MNGKTQQLLDRTFWFGVNVMKFLKKLPKDSIYKIPKFQLERSSISVGANYEEAQGAVSKRDFSNKVGICYKESRESVSGTKKYFRSHKKELKINLNHLPYYIFHKK